MTAPLPGRRLNELDFVSDPIGSEIYGNKGGQPYRIQVGGPSGMTTLDDGGKVPVEQVPDDIANLRADLAAVAAGKGGDLVKVKQPEADAVSFAIGPEILIKKRPEHYRDAADTDDTNMIKRFLAHGHRGDLISGKTYQVSSGIPFFSNAGLACDGEAIIHLKTGAGGFNVTSQGGTRTDTDRCAFPMVNVDNVLLDGILLEVEQTAEVVLYGIRSSSGLATKGLTLGRIRGTGFHMGTMISLNSVGAGGYRAEFIDAFSCGATQGNARFGAGTGQFTVFELDNDMVGGVTSAPGLIRAMRFYNILHSGQAKTDYGQQTDVFNAAGMSATDRKGPRILDISGEGVGEVVDLFCDGASIGVSRVKNVHGFVAKMIHGGRYNRVNVDTVESCGLAVVTFAGSATATRHTEGNIVRVGTARGVGDSGDGPTSADVCAVLMQKNGGAIGTCLPRNNLVEFGYFTGGANCDFAVKDNCDVDDGNKNIVRFERPPSGYTAFGSISVDNNTRIEVSGRDRIEACLTGNQTPLTSATDTIVSFNEVISDRQAQHNTGTFKTRIKYPGTYRIKGSVRGAFNTGDDVTIKLLKNGVPIAQVASEPSSGTLQYTYAIDKVVEILPSEANTAAADVWLVANVTSSGTITLTDTNSMTFIEVTPIEG